MNDVVVVGSFVQDLCFRTGEFPAPGETRIGTFASGPGGKGFNQAVACHRQGVRTLFVGAVGEDLFAEELVAFARKEGMTLKLQCVPNITSGAASIVVNSAADNLIVVALGANQQLSVDHIEGCRAEISRSEIVVAQAECNLEAGKRALQIAAEEGVLSLLNPAPINDSLDIELLHSADILTPNETEFTFLLNRFCDMNHSDTAALFKNDQALHDCCLKIGCPTIVLTMGKRGCFVSHNPAIDGGTELHKSLGVTDLYYRVPALEVAAVDSTGAGDAFTGGLAAGLVQYPGDFQEAVRLATAVAGVSTEKEGTAPAMPTQTEVLDRRR